MRVLILEDDIMHYRLILRLLQDIVPEAQCDHATTGEDACQSFVETAYDLAILDVCLRGMDGLDVTRFMFNSPNCAKTGSFVVTGLDEDEHRVAELRNMGLDICFKPVDVAVFKNCVMRALCGGGQARYQANLANRPAAKPVYAVDPAKPLPIFDISQGLRASIGSKELLRDVLETFMANAPERLAQLDDSVAAGNFRNAGDVAHAIKGTAATVGASRLSAAAAKIVNGVRYEHPEEVIAGHDELRREFDMLTAEVARINWEIV